jgi:hypothetical protein
MDIQYALDLITEAIGCDGNASLDEALATIRKALADVQKCGMAFDSSCVHKRGGFCIADMVWFDHCEFRVV